MGYDGRVRKILFFLTAFFFYFFIVGFSINIAYAQCTSLTIARATAPYAFPFDVNKNITLTNSSDCLDTSKTYIILAYPSSVEASPGLYANYSIDRKQPTDGKTLPAKINLNQGSIGRKSPGAWNLKVCSATASSDCGGQNNIEGTLTFFVFSTIPTTTAAPIATSGPRPTSAPTPIAPAFPCEQKVGDECKAVKTAIGNITTNPAEFIKKIFTVLLSMSGGWAVYLIITAGYQFMFSQGDPESVKEAREKITSAIVGLVFMILSLIVLRVIGVDIFALPTFR